MENSCDSRKNKNKHSRWICQHANPLFEKWLLEWKKEAEKNGSNNKYNFQKAIISLRKFPLPVYSGEDCRILANFGDKICKRIDNKLSEFQEENGHINWDSYIKIKDARKRSTISKEKKAVYNRLPDFEKTNPSVKKNKLHQKSCKYIPSYRSGAYAVVIALINASQKDHFLGYLEEDELLKAAQTLCHASSMGSLYTEFLSLIDKKLIKCDGSPSRYSLTKDGLTLGLRLLDDHITTSSTLSHFGKKNRQNFSFSPSSQEQRFKNPVKVHDISSSEDDECNLEVPLCEKEDNCNIQIQDPCQRLEVPYVINSSSISPMEVEINNIRPLYELTPASFKVILCVDNQEVLAGATLSNKGTKEVIVKELKKHGVEFTIRKLHVGDFLWVCQEISSSGKPRELVLPFVIERKRMDDLAHSIKDGRFREQKFRLKQTGLSHLIYLVEQFGSKYLSIPLSTCEQAVTNTQLIDDFQIKITMDQIESAAYLTVMTRYLQNLFKRKSLRCVCRSNWKDQELSSLYIDLVAFEELNSFSIKNRHLSVKEMFAKHLIQISGLSVDKANAILEKYPTPLDLLMSLPIHDEQEKEQFLASLKCPLSDRSLGPVLSAHLIKLYSKKVLT